MEKQQHYQQQHQQNNSNNNNNNFTTAELNRKSFEQRLQKTITNLKVAESCFSPSLLAQDSQLVPQSVSTTTFQQGHTLHTLLCGVACPNLASNKRRAVTSDSGTIENKEQFCQESINDAGIAFYRNLNNRRSKGNSPDGEDHFESAFEESFENEERQQREKQRNLKTPTKPSSSSKELRITATSNPQTSNVLLEEEDEETTLMLLNTQFGQLNSKMVTKTTVNDREVITTAAEHLDVIELRKDVSELKSGLNCMSEKVELIVDQLNRTLNDSKFSDKGDDANSDVIPLNGQHGQQESFINDRQHLAKNAKIGHNDFHSWCKFILKQRMEALREYYKIRLFILREEQLKAPTREERRAYDKKHWQLVDEFDAQKRQIKQELRGYNIQEGDFLKHSIELTKMQSETMRLNTQWSKLKSLEKEAMRSINKTDKVLRPLFTQQPRDGNVCLSNKQPLSSASSSSSGAVELQQENKLPLPNPELALDLSGLNEPNEFPSSTQPPTGVYYGNAMQKVVEDGQREETGDQKQEENFVEEENAEKIEKEQEGTDDQTVMQVEQIIGQEMEMQQQQMEVEEEPALIAVEQISLSGNRSNNNNSSVLEEHITSGSKTSAGADQFARIIEIEQELNVGYYNEEGGDVYELEVVSAREQSNRTESSRQRTSAEIESIPEEIPSLRDANSSSIFSQSLPSTTQPEQQLPNRSNDGDEEEEVPNTDSEVSNRVFDQEKEVGEEEDGKLMLNALLSHPFVQTRKCAAPNDDVVEEEGEEEAVAANNEENDYNGVGMKTTTGHNNMPIADEECSDGVSAAFFQLSEKSLQSILSSTRSCMSTSGRDSMSRRRSSASEALLKLRLMNNVPVLAQPEPKGSPRTPRSPLGIERFTAKFPHQLATGSREASFNNEEDNNNGNPSSAATDAVLIPNAAVTAIEVGTRDAADESTVELLDELPNTSKLGMLLDLSQSPSVLTNECLFNGGETPPTPKGAQPKQITTIKARTIEFGGSSITTQQQLPRAPAQKPETATTTNDGTAKEEEEEETKLGDKFARQSKLIDECAHLLWAEYQAKGAEYDGGDYPDDDFYASDLLEEHNGTLEETAMAEQCNAIGNAIISDLMVHQLCAESLLTLVQTAPYSAVARYALSSEQLFAEHLRDQIIGPMVDPRKRDTVVCSVGVRQRTAQTSHVEVDTNRLLLAEWVYGTGGAGGAMCPTMFPQPSI